MSADPLPNISETRLLSESSKLFSVTVQVILDVPG